eukprot:14117862-Alexandrium_andersonii.AAC.1
MATGAPRLSELGILGAFPLPSIPGSEQGDSRRGARSGPALNEMFRVVRYKMHSRCVVVFRAALLGCCIVLDSSAVFCGVFVYGVGGDWKPR